MKPKIEIPTGDYKIKRRFELVARPKEEDATDIYLYGYVTDSRGWWDDEDCIATDEVRKLILSVETGVINLHLNSPGGYAFEGIAIYNLLKQHKAKIHVYIDGYAASAGSLIAMAGDKIFMPANTMLMIHKASTIIWGNADALRAEANMLEKLDTAVSTSYKVHFNKSDAELAELLKGESGDGTWFTADEAKFFGFCDEVLEEIKLDEPGEDEEPPKESPKETMLKMYGFTGNTTNKNKPQAKFDFTKRLEAFFNGVTKK